MRNILPPLSLLAGLAACATGPTLDQRLATHMGRTELELVSALGVPARSYETGGVKFLQYEEQRTVALPAGYGGYGLGWGPYGRFYGSGFATAYAPVQCDITFTLRDGRVVAYAYRGQGCA